MQPSLIWCTPRLRLRFSARLHGLGLAAGDVIIGVDGADSSAWRTKEELVEALICDTAFHGQYTHKENKARNRHPNPGFAAADAFLGLAAWPHPRPLLHAGVDFWPHLLFFFRTGRARETVSLTVLKPLAGRVAAGAPTRPAVVVEGRGLGPGSESSSRAPSASPRLERQRQPGSAADAGSGAVAGAARGWCSTAAAVPCACVAVLAACILVLAALVAAVGVGVGAGDDGSGWGGEAGEVAPAAARRLLLELAATLPAEATALALALRRGCADGEGGVLAALDAAVLRVTEHAVATTAFAQELLRGE